MSVGLSDTFTDTNATVLSSHTGESGHSWTKHGSYTPNWLVQTNRAYSSSTGQPGAYYSAWTPGSADYSVEAVVFARTLTTAGYNGPAGRVDVAANTMYAVRYLHGTGWELYKVEAGSLTVLATWAETLTTSDSRTARLRMVGTTIEMYVDGTLRGSATDSSIAAAGVPGMRGFNSTSTTGFHIDAIVAYNPTAATLGQPSAANTAQSLTVVQTGGEQVVAVAQAAEVDVALPVGAAGPGAVAEGRRVPNVPTLAAVATTHRRRVRRGRRR